MLDLIKRISFDVHIIRAGNGEKMLLPASEIRIGDEVNLHAGSMIPADLKLSISENLEVDESVLTLTLTVLKKVGDPVFMGTIVTGGNAHGIVAAIGMDTKYGKISEMAGKQNRRQNFKRA